MADENAVKPWRCENGHVLGVVRRNGSHVAKLYLYRQAVDLAASTDEEIQEVDVLVIIEGYAADARCSVCGAIRSWIPGKAALDKLVKRYQERALEAINQKELVNTHLLS